MIVLGDWETMTAPRNYVEYFFGIYHFPRVRRFMLTSAQRTNACLPSLVGQNPRSRSPEKSSIVLGRSLQTRRTSSQMRGVWLLLLLLGRLRRGMCMLCIEVELSSVWSRSTPFIELKETISGPGMVRELLPNHRAAR